MFFAKPRLLFVCAGNTCRSPMAAAIAQKLYGHRYRIESAGAGASAQRGEPAAPNAVKVMAEQGLDISKHKSRWLADLTMADFDVIVAFSESIRQVLADRGAVANVQLLQISDPFGGDMNVYRNTAAEIETKLPRLLG
jgi:protein-tyrosine phosphatase